MERMPLVVDVVVEEALRELADEDAQTRLWLASEGPEISSLTECRCRLWDDSGLGDALEKPGVVYAPVIDSRFRDLGSVLSRIDDRRPPTQILTDPDLDAARTLARELLLDLRAFGYGQN